jgi:hypothetical protein
VIHQPVSPTGGRRVPVSQLSQGDGGWEGVLTTPDGATHRLTLHTRADHTIPGTLDGLAGGLLPVVMRFGGVLRVAGPLTAQMVRNLTDLADGWSSWIPDHFRPVIIEPDELVDCPWSPMAPTAAFAWSGSVRSTHTLLRHLDGTIPGSVRPQSAVRVTGLRPGDRPAADSFPGADPLAERGVDPVIVTASATAAVIDRRVGVLPIVAAALHLVAGPGGTTIHARPGPVTALRRYPRSEPGMPDLYSGGITDVRCDGGVASMGEMATAIARHPRIAAALSGCERHPRSAPPCGRCPGCILTALAFASQNLPPPRPELELRRTRVGLLPLGRPETVTDLQGIFRDWQATRGGLYRVIRQRLRANGLGVMMGETARWLGAAAGVRPVWPR